MRCDKVGISVCEICEMNWDTGFKRIKTQLVGRGQLLKYLKLPIAALLV